MFFGFLIIAPLLMGSQSNFQKSWDEELHEMAGYYLDPKIETIDEVKAQILADKDASKKRHYADRISSMQDIMKSCSSNGQEDVVSVMLDFQETFERLKKKMNIPVEVDLMYCDDQSLASSSDAFMSYSVFDRTVYMYPKSFKMCPSYRLFTMIHELTHTLQHKREGMLKHFLNSQDEKLHAKQEHEADSNAAETIQCPLCMKAILAFQLLQEGSAKSQEIIALKNQGYLTSNDLKKSLEQKSLDCMCKVHKSVENLDIWSGLDTQEGLEQIFENDCESLSMSERLS